VIISCRIWTEEFASWHKNLLDARLSGIWDFYYGKLGTADGGTVVKVLCYKSEGRWFDSRWHH
jgi:hypothetical protein